MAIREGIEAVNQSKRIGMLFYGANLLFAAAVIAPVVMLAARLLGHSLYSSELFQSYDIQWEAEFQFANPHISPISMAPLIVLVVLTYILLNTFMSGGALAAFHSRPDTFALSVFVHSCGKYFFRLFRLVLWSLPAYGLVVGVNAGLGKAIEPMLEESTVEQTVAMATWGRAGLIVVLFFLVNMIFDYAKIRCVVEDSRKTFREVLRAIRFVFVNLRRTATLYFLLVFLGLALLTGYIGATNFIVENSILTMVIVILLGQLFLMARIWVRLLFYSSQMILYKELCPARGASAIASLPGDAVIEESRS